MFSIVNSGKFSLFLLHFAVVALLPVSYIAQAGPYTGSTTSSLIKWRSTVNDNFDFTDTPHASVWFSSNSSAPDTSRYSFFVDTGSCGIVTAKKKVNILASEQVAANRAWHFLSSSKTLYTGWWVERYVWFNHDDVDRANEIKSLLKVLAVDVKYTNCVGWKPENTDTCPDASATSDSDPDTQILGISYGRTYDGQPQGTPDKNAFLNVVSMATGPMAQFHYGWIVDLRGITVGLTDGNWGVGFSDFEVQLGDDRGAPPPSALAHQHPWGEVPGCVLFPGIPSSTCIECSVLLDTGIDYASIRVPKVTAQALGRDSSNNHLLNSQAVDIRIGSMSRPPRSVDAFTTPDSPPRECDITPSYAQVYNDPTAGVIRPPFVNTGRHLFRRWAQGFDPLRGIVGFLTHNLPPQLVGGTHACPGP
ncbi:MAG: hypothetical protein M1839_000083 [Geoglossum umbratile]|nr:MAG: hypothetical protein M1839_000083 [Geoglossum umbratile]